MDASQTVLSFNKFKVNPELKKKNKRYNKGRLKSKRYTIFIRYTTRISRSRN